LFRFSQIVVRRFVVIDGFVGMQGGGPLYGDAIESQVALASTDWLTADRVGAYSVMGFDFGKMGHYRYSAEAGKGEANLERIRLVGDPLGECKTQYEAPSSVDKTLIQGACLMPST
jgi:uncharacterized protein (DUF362 family)